MAFSICPFYKLRLSRGIPEQREPPVRNHDAAVSGSEALFPFVIVMLPLDELRISFRPERTFMVNDLVPFFKKMAQFAFISISTITVDFDQFFSRGVV